MTPPPFPSALCSPFLAAPPPLPPCNNWQSITFPRVVRKAKQKELRLGLLNKLAQTTTRDL